MEASANEEKFGIAQRRKINGEMTAPNEMIMRRLIKNRSRITTKMTKRIRNIRVSNCAFLVTSADMLYTFTSHDRSSPPVA